jgi:hypothetical protein
MLLLSLGEDRQVSEIQALPDRGASIPTEDYEGDITSVATAENKLQLLLAQAASPYPRASAPSLIAQSTGISIEETERQLAVLKRLCEQGLVSKEECQSRQASIY